MGGSGGRGAVMLRAFLLAAFVIACPVHAGIDAHAGAADVPTPPAQARSTVRILDAPAGWAIEQIPIPLGFAPSLGFTGLEDVRFAPGWSAPGSPEFWTYKFAWEIAEDPRLDEERLARMLETYYDGLSRAVSQLGDSLQAPAAVFVRDGDDYRGRLRIYDAFATNEWIHLNARVKSSKRDGKHLLVFELSPQRFGHEVWRKLASIRVSRSGAPAPTSGE